ncbi:MAG: NAD(P)H-binding protein [Myxococcales bacterium]|nr:NAD(P)H-binding protein [Myxococcales bacterium]
MSDLPTVVVAGAAGFVGRALLDALAGDAHRVGLSRSRRPGVAEDGVEWRACDLFSLLDAERGLAGADLAVYLVHSMLPSAHLTQGRFQDFDLVLADNFARAAAHAGVRRIVYLGGLVPEDGALSAHLQSRLEVERALGAHGVPVTTLRAGLVVGPHGSSSTILTKLVGRLPVMLTPRWTATPTQPIALRDVVELIGYCLRTPETAGGTYDVGAPEVLTYREMMAETARVMGVSRRFVPVPLLTPRLSTLWVSLVTGASRALVGPLVESLRHPMVCGDRRLQTQAGQTPTPFAEAMRAALQAEQAPAKPRRRRRARSPQRDVRSVQRLPLPPGRDAMWVARAYTRWLPDAFRPMLAVEHEGPRVVFRLRPGGRHLLELTLSEDRSTPDRALLYVTGGALAEVDPTDARRGRLEFRAVLDDRAVVAAVHDFVPRLPWPIYAATQAWAHLAVMHAFGLYLGRQPAA